MKNKFEETVSQFKKLGKWSDLEKFLSQHENGLGTNHLYLWVQSLIKTGRFIKAQDVLDLRFSDVEKTSFQFLKFRFDLMYERRNFPEAVKVAKSMVATAPSELDPKIRLVKALMGEGNFAEASNIALELRGMSVGNDLVFSFLRDFENKKSDYELNKNRINNIARKFSISDAFDLSPVRTQGCSVVVPCYNVENFVERTVQSILDCGHHDLEIILVDDCSTDGTLNIINKFRAENSDLIKIVRHKKNSGLAAARNTGLLSANMPYVTFIDSDDLMVRGGVSRRVNCLHRARMTDERFIGSYGGSVTIDEDAIFPPVSTPVQGMKIIDYLSTDGLCPFNANQPLFITEFLRLSGGFPESEKTAEDWPFWIFLLRMGGKIAPTHSVDVTYRMRRNSMVRVTAALHLKNSYRILNSVEEESNLLYSKPYHSYGTQKKFVERYFNFLGMKIASCFEKNRDPALVSKELSSNFFCELTTYLPDLCFINHNVKFVKSRILQGIARYYCVKAVEQLIDAKVLDDIARGFALGAHSFASSTLTAMHKNSYNAMQQKIDVVFLPHKEYHAKSAELIGRQLEKLGVSWCIADFSCQYGDEGVSSYLLASEAPALTINNLCLGLVVVSAAIVFNDWDPTVKVLLDTIKAQGARTIGIVEGVNDYLSVDTGVWRPAYRYVDTLFIPGEFHKKYFYKHDSIYIAGVQRLDPLVLNSNECKPTSERKLACVINCNFTYGVLQEHRIYFLKSICDVLMDLGITPIISRHPQDVGDIGEYQKYVTKQSMYELLEDAKIFITRFSGAVYEGLLSGAHVVYFNPGIERWDMFSDSCGSYDYVTNSIELRAVIKKLSCESFSLSKAKDFLQKHCDIDDSGVASSQKTAIAISELLKSKKCENPTGLQSGSFFDLIKNMRAAIERSEFNLAFGVCKKIITSKAAKTDTQRFILATEEKRLNRLFKNIDGIAMVNQGGVGFGCKNLFLIFSCQKYSERIKILQPYYSKGLRHGDRFVFVVGGAESDHLDGDVLHLQCGDSYEKLPEKVFKSFCYAFKNFDFERVVKIDDDIFVNFENFYKVVSSDFRYDYYGRKNPPNFGHPLNRKWHYGKVSKGHRYDGKEFPLVEPAQWCSGGCYIVSKYAAEQVAKYDNFDFVENHVFEDHMIFDILSSFDVYPFFHENSRLQDMVWMEPTLDKVMDRSLSAINGEFDLGAVVTIHCGPTNKYKVEADDLERVFRILDNNTLIRIEA